jgi:anti-sigma B factor antagonist
VSQGAAEGREPPVKQVDRSDGAVVVHLVGELDLYNAHDVRETLLACCAEEPEKLVVDLAGVTFVDSTALGVFIEARSRLADRQSFVLASPGPETRRALEISGLDRHLNVRESVDQALSS